MGTDWADGGPLDPPERGDWESAVEAARTRYATCPECDAPTIETESGDRLACSRGSECPACWSATDEEMVEAWAEAHELDPSEGDDGSEWRSRKRTRTGH